MKRDNVIIHAWTLQLSPDGHGTVITGEVYGHPNFDNGTLVTSSRLKSFDIERKLAVTENTVYELGVEARREYKAQLLQLVGDKKDEEKK